MPDVPVTDRINYVDGAIQSLDKETARISALAKDLLLRLKPVMRNEPNGIEADSSKASETSVPLADKIAVYSRTLSGTGDILNGILDRLEI